MTNLARLENFAKSVAKTPCTFAYCGKACGDPFTPHDFRCLSCEARSLLGFVGRDSAARGLNIDTAGCAPLNERGKA